MTILIRDKLVTELLRNYEEDDVWPILEDDVTNTSLLQPIYELSSSLKFNGKAKSINITRGKRIRNVHM